MDKALKRHDVDAKGCMQLGVCSYVRKAALDVLEGRADSTDLIVDGLSRSGNSVCVCACVCVSCVR